MSNVIRFKTGSGDPSSYVVVGDDVNAMNLLRAISRNEAHSKYEQAKKIFVRLK